MAGVQSQNIKDSFRFKMVPWFLVCRLPPAACRLPARRCSSAVLKSNQTLSVLTSIFGVSQKEYHHAL